MEIFQVILALLGAATLLSWIAGRLSIPYPSFLVLGGLALGFLPILPGIALDPHLAFALFLPPILFEAAYYTSWREFRANIRPIASLAVVLVGLTTWIVAIVTDWLIPELPLQAAIVLGAIVSPPDAAAATAVLRKMKLPRRVITIVEGESLVNDAAALVIYNFAVAQVVTGRFSLSEAALALAISVVASLSLGFGIGWIWSKMAQRIGDPLIGVTASFLIAFAAYLTAEALHISGVLAVVTAGLVFARLAPHTLGADIRLNAGAVWGVAIFVLNAIAFILIGLQLPRIVAELPGYSVVTLAEDGAIIAVTVILVRLIWVAGVSQTIRWIGGTHARQTVGDWREALVIGWSGMRGLVSLAAALALPDTIDGGGPFPARDLVLFMAFAVILATLVIQGLSLGALIRLVGIKDDDTAEQEERTARIEGATAAIAAIDELAETPALPGDILDRLRSIYISRLQQWTGGDSEDPDNPSNADFLDAVRLTAIAAERRAIVDLRQRRIIGDTTFNKIQHELDLNESSVKRGRPAYAQASWLDLARPSRSGPRPTP